METTNAELPCLIRRAQTGRDARAFDALVRRFQDRAVAYARSILRDPAAAEDAAQDAFVQAWHDLPALKEPAAFPAWLRRIVFKHCDRARRSAPRFALVSLDAAFHVSGGPTPVDLAVAGEDAARVRAALHSLPEREREAALLYYLGGSDLAEIGAFLGVTKTTVKNRLHAARRRLRKELWDMAEVVLEEEKPSQGGEFAGGILERVVEEFRRQMQVDPHTADRSLLAQGRADLVAVLDKPGPLSRETVQAGFQLLYRQYDLKAIAALLSRYLAQPLDDGQAAWAYLHLSNWLACAGDPAGAVLAHEALERWLPGRRPRLSKRWPYYPVEGDPAEGVYAGEDELTLLALGKSAEFATAFRGVWREGEYVDRVESALARIPATDANRELRFSCLRMSSHLCETGRRFEDGARYVERMYALAAEPEREEDRAYWRAKALGHDVRLRLKAGDREGFRTRSDELLGLLSGRDADWVRGERHDLGCQMVGAGEYTEAMRLFDANEASGGQVGPWGYFMHATAVWKAIGDRPRTLALLRDSSARDARNMLHKFRAQPEFSGVLEDTEFVAAARGPG